MKGISQKSTRTSDGSILRTNRRLKKIL